MPEETTATPPKAGFKTSEFWAMIVVVVGLPLLRSAGFEVDPELDQESVNAAMGGISQHVLAAVAIAVYTWSRVRVKESGA